jgi:hypothetical protein
MAAEEALRMLGTRFASWNNVSNALMYMYFLCVQNRTLMRRLRVIFR